MKHLSTQNNVPWFRVVNASGQVHEERAEQRLISEGVSVSNYRVSLKQYQWKNF